MRHKSHLKFPPHPIISNDVRPQLWYDCVVFLLPAGLEEQRGFRGHYERQQQLPLPASGDDAYTATN